MNTFENSREREECMTQPVRCHLTIHCLHWHLSSFSEEWVLHIWYLKYILLMVPFHLFQKWSFSKISYALWPNFIESFHLNLLFFVLHILFPCDIIMSKMHQKTSLTLSELHFWLQMYYDIRLSSTKEFMKRLFSAKTTPNPFQTRF